MLKHGGCLAFVEPYCATVAAKPDSAALKSRPASTNRPTSFMNGTDVYQCRIPVSAPRGSENRSRRSTKRLTAVTADCSRGFYDGRLSVVDAPGEVDAGVHLPGDDFGSKIGATLSGIQSVSFPSMRASISAVATETATSFSPSIMRVRRSRRNRSWTACDHCGHVTAAREPGEYVAEIDLVHESVRWFASKGLGYHPVRFRVSAP